MTVAQFLSWGVVALGTAAGMSWWVASWVSMHPRRRGPGLGGAGGTVQQLGDTVRRQCAWHAAACGMAGTAALLQALSLTLHLLA